MRRKTWHGISPDEDAISPRGVMSPSSIRDMLALSDPARDAYLDHLVPPELKTHYGLPDRGNWERGGSGRYRWDRIAHGAGLRLEVWPRLEGEDPSLALDLADSYYGQIDVSGIVINDVDGPRFDVDRFPCGRRIPAGSPDRNIEEELRALEAGLAPYQVRPGLRLLHAVVGCLERLAAALGVGILYLAPLAYHNAIQYERSGFCYASDLDELLRIHREFGPGGVLRQRMDGSTPFRRPEMADTVRGRSWAIHDGVLERRWIAPQMYKLVGHDCSTSTFPDAPW